MIKAIIFDWGGVLIDDPAPERIRLLARYFDVSEDKLRAALIKFEPDFQLNKLTEHEFLANIIQDLGVRRNIQSVWVDSFIDVFREKKDVLSLAHRLKFSGYKLGLLSNIERPMADILRNLHYDFFDEFVFSCESGFLKPDPKSYELVLSKLGVKPKEVVFIDDKIKNIESAQSLGINTLLFVSCNKLKSDLSKLGVVIKDLE